MTDHGSLTRMERRCLARHRQPCPGRPRRRDEPVPCMYEVVSLPVVTRPTWQFVIRVVADPNPMPRFRLFRWLP